MTYEEREISIPTQGLRECDVRDPVPQRSLGICLVEASRHAYLTILAPKLTVRTYLMT